MNTGVFTTLKVKNSIPLFLELHQKRLLTHAQKMHLGDVNLSQDEIKEYIKNNNLKDCTLKITVLNQDGKIIKSFQTRPLPPPISFGKLITSRDTRNRLKIYKTTDRSVNEKAQKLAEEKNTSDALFVLNGEIIESTICNIFSLNNNGQLITPDITGKGLQGIMRRVIMDNSTVIEKTIPETTTGPIVLVNSLRMFAATNLNNQQLINPQLLLEKLQTVINNAEKKYLAIQTV